MNIRSKRNAINTVVNKHYKAHNSSSKEVVNLKPNPKTNPAKIFELHRPIFSLCFCLSISGRMYIKQHLRNQVMSQCLGYEASLFFTIDLEAS